MRITGALLLVIIMLVAGSCVDIPKYDHAPRIEFVGIDKFIIDDDWGKRPYVRVTLSFEDGDGDLGEDAQSEERQKILLGNGGWGNYHAEMFYLSNNNWVKYDTELLRFLVFPILKTDGVKGPIRGKLDYDLALAEGQDAKEIPVKFLIKIRDRELRESNTIETDTIHVPFFSDF